MSTTILSDKICKHGLQVTGGGRHHWILLQTLGALVAPEINRLRGGRDLNHVKQARFFTVLSCVPSHLFTWMLADVERALRKAPPLFNTQTGVAAETSLGYPHRVRRPQHPLRTHN